jgi:ribonuclease-3
MSTKKSLAQKRASFASFTRVAADAPLVPPVEGVDFTPFQTWAREHLGFEFHNPSLLVTAFTHRSYVNEHRKTAKTHNERLEFLGDAVLELASTEFLFRNYAEPEGILTNWRAALVRTESIRDAGDTLEYFPLIRMSRGEKRDTGAAHLHIVANAFEALIGAIYLDQGYAAAEAFIAKHILGKIDEILEDGRWRDAKSHLQEISQRLDDAIPEYRVIEETGPDHGKTFTIGAFVAGREMGRGEGTSKQIAQQAAAREALKTYRKEQNKSRK